jgi:4-hydroxy-2-oxoheptanedioate aldolase
MYRNRTREKVLSGVPALGVTITLGAPLAGEVLAQAGFDFIMVDNQHGGWDESGSLLAFRGIVLGGATPFVRVQQNDYYTIGRVLDAGTLGVVVPMVNTRGDAEEAARAVRYVPRGQRSIGPFGTAFLGADYAKGVDDEVYLAVQIETIGAVERADDILGVEGVDGCWVGPADMAASMGLDLTLAGDREKHEAAIMRALAACQRQGKVPGIAGRSDNAADWIARGFRFVTVGSDAMLLGDRGAAVIASVSNG